MKIVDETYDPKAPKPKLSLRMAVLYGLILSTVAMLADKSYFHEMASYPTSDAVIQTIGRLIPGPVIFVAVAAAINLFRSRFSTRLNRVRGDGESEQ